MNTPRKSKCDRTPTKATCDRTPTPRTDEAWAAWQYAGSGMSVHVGRELERELTAAREEINILKSKYADHHVEAERITSEIKTVTERLALAPSLLTTKKLCKPITIHRSLTP